MRDRGRSERLADRDREPGQAEQHPEQSNGERVLNPLDLAQNIGLHRAAFGLREKLRKHMLDHCFNRPRPCRAQFRRFPVLRVSQRVDCYAKRNLEQNRNRVKSGKWGFI